MNRWRTDEEEADRLDGIFAGACQPEEYLPLIKAGLLKRSYEGVAGFMGLAKLRRVYPEQQKEL